MNASVFAPRNNADVVNLVNAHPLAWVVPHANPALARPLPLRIERCAEGRVATLTGHYARHYPQVALLQAQPRAQLLFLGPHGYVSPSWFHDRTQAPTWNFATASFDVTIEFLDTAGDLDRIVRDLVDAMESGRDDAWCVDDMKARYQLLLQRIIPFRATVDASEARFKLGQDERDDTYPEIIGGLERDGHAALVALMNEFNPRRPQGSEA